MTAHSIASDRIALVTGASRGIGQCIAIALASHGMPVVAAARNLERAQETAQQIRESGGIAIAAYVDVSNPGSVQALRTHVAAAFGTVTVLVNAAGVFGPIQLIQDSDPAKWVETIMVNAVGPYLLCETFVGDMVRYGWGRVINVTSAAALHKPGPLNSAYGTSKAALNHFTRHLAAEIAGTGVTANVIHPGEVKTDMWAYIRDKFSQLGPLGEGYRQWARWVDETGGDPPQKSADLVLKLVSDEAAGINGQFLWIDDGLQSPVPSW